VNLWPQAFFFPNPTNPLSGQSTVIFYFLLLLFFFSGGGVFCIISLSSSSCATHRDASETRLSSLGPENSCSSTSIFTQLQMNFCQQFLKTKPLQVL
jgi:hypothetical protein